MFVQPAKSRMYGHDRPREQGALGYLEGSLQLCSCAKGTVQSEGSWRRPWPFRGSRASLTPRSLDSLESSASVMRLAPVGWSW